MARTKEMPPKDDDALTPEEQARLDANDRFLADMQARNAARREKIDGELATLSGAVTGLLKDDEEVEANARALEVETVAKLDKAAQKFLGIDEPEEKSLDK